MTEPQPAGRTRPHGAGPAARRVVAETVLISVALGLAVGLVWWLVAPEVSVGVRSGQSVLIAAEARNLFGVDVSFAAVGTVAGLLLGLFGAWAALFSINRLTDASIDFSVPVLLLAVVLVLGVVLGLLASLIPARRSTRLDVLEAIQSTLSAHAAQPASATANRDKTAPGGRVDERGRQPDRIGR